MIARTLLLASISALSLVSADQLDPWNAEYANTPDLSFSGVTSFAHLPHKKCLDLPETAFDIALLGVPFDSAVSYRPGELLRPLEVA
jgi:agmatinase